MGEKGWQWNPIITFHLVPRNQLGDEFRGLSRLGPAMEGTAVCDDLI